MSSITKVLVRHLRIDDFSDFESLFEEVDAIHREALPDYFKKPEQPARTQKAFARLLGDTDVGLLGAESDGHLVGFVYVLLQRVTGSPIQVDRKLGLIDVLVVNKNCRKQGIGAELVRAAQAWAKLKGATKMELGVWEFDGSLILFYEKIGYRTLCRRMSITL